jgi:serine/threonine protein kinase
MQEIFVAAVERHRPEDWDAYLDHACGADDDLRRQVKLLLKAHHEAGSVPGAALPERDQTGAFQTLAEVAGSVVGPYKLLQQLGEGGMGTVWMAEQTQPVQRRVALKLIKSGMDSRQVIARFEAERQALALMDHPNIAKVFDASTTESGRPYFVMELVKGVAITKYCDEHHLTCKARLELFVPVCQAVQHAHQKGIIHRDLKPSNVLVCLYDGKPVPKVIDFGVAKAAGPRLTEKTLFTELGQVVGTLEYMSPEQAELNQLDIDTRSDIHSLGVLLYELLTGTTPLERKRFKAAAFLEVLRLIREEESPRPSARLSTTEGLPTIAANRGLEPKKLSGLLRGELDWIVMKALEKDRSRRYETANGFALDLQRYLADEPVAAGPPSARYRLKKFYRRNRGPVVALVFILLALVGGILGTTLGLLQAQASEEQAQNDAIRAKQERDRANKARIRANQAREAERKSKEAEKVQRKRAEVARTNEARQRRRAEAARDRAAATLDAMTSSIVGDALTQQKALTPEQRQFLTRALEYYRELLKDKVQDEKGRKRLAAAAVRVGWIEKRLGRTKKGVVMLRQARDLYSQLAKELPANRSYREALASSHAELGNCLAELGSWDEAMAELRTAITIEKQLVARFPKIPQYRRNIANSHAGLGSLLFHLEKWDLAEKEKRAAIAIEKQLVAEFPAIPAYAAALANSRNGLACILQGTQKWDQAETEFQAALKIQKHLAAAFPRDQVHRVHLAVTRMNWAALLVRLRKWNQADTEFREALDIARKLLTESPGELEYVESVGTILHNLGIVAVSRGRPNDTLAWFEQGIATLSPVVAREPRLVGARLVLRNSHSSRAEALDKLKRYNEAAKHWDAAMRLSQGFDKTLRHYKLMLSRRHAGQFELAMKDADVIAPIGSSYVVYNCACVYAVAHAKTKDDKHAARAVALLRQAVAKGFRNLAHMKKDADLASLRDRDDFKKLLAGLETK